MRALILVRVLLVWQGGLAALSLPLPQPAYIGRLDPEEGASDWETRDPLY
jgi:hypothetical protein